MFWWSCGDFSSMAGIFNNNNGNSKKDDSASSSVEHDQRFASIYTYNTAAQFKPNKYGAFEGQLSNNFPPLPSTDIDIENHELEEGGGSRTISLPSTATDRLVEYTCTALSSTLFLLTLPFSLFFSLRFVGPSERLVVMRLGRARAVYGQGTVLVLPLVDKATTVDLRVTSMELPDIHVFTADRGMVEVAAVLFTKIADPLAVCCALQNREQTLRTLAYTSLTRHLTKRLLNDITNPTSLGRILAKCQEELNDFCRPHGVQVDQLTAPGVRILQQAENAAVSVFQTLVKSDVGKQLMGQLGLGGHLRNLTGAAASTAAMAPGQQHPEQQQQANSGTAEKCNGEVGGGTSALNGQANVVDPELDALLGRIRQCMSNDQQLVQRVGKHFRVHCPELAGCRHEFDIDLRGTTTIAGGQGGPGWCGWTWERRAPSFDDHSTEQPPDVHFTLDKRTLVSLVEGSLSPMSAYLEGLVKIQGSVQDAIALRHLADAVASSTGGGGKNIAGAASGGNAGGGQWI